MSLLLAGIAWIFDGANWPDGASPGIASQLLGQLGYTAISVVICAVIAIPVGLAIGHTGRGRTAAILLSNAARALPTLGLFSIVVIALTLQPDWLNPVVPLVILGIPPLLAGAYAGLESVDRQTVDAARAMGMTEWQVLLKAELPLGAPLLVGGLRSAVLQIAATATLASVYSYTTLGNSIILGLSSNDYVQMVGGALLVTALALLLDAAFALLQRFVVPRGVPRGARGTTTARGRRIRSTTPLGAPIAEGN